MCETKLQRMLKQLIALQNFFKKQSKKARAHFLPTSKFGGRGKIDRASLVQKRHFQERINYAEQCLGEEEGRETMEDKKKWSREDYKSRILVKKRKNHKWFKDNVPLFEIASNSKKFKPQKKIIFDTLDKKQADAVLKFIKKCLSAKVPRLHQKDKLLKFEKDLKEIYDCKTCAGKPLKTIKQKGGIILPWLAHTVLRGAKRKKKKKKKEEYESAEEDF